ncbi:MAG: beta-N-acetylhexosaminidase [Bryobacterales bacterium]|nr:beta-N-acetylhexosaminidase [Bryobacterales bacterium]
MRFLVILLLCAAGFVHGETATALWMRGYSVIPTPRSVQLDAGDVAVDGAWSIDVGKVAPGHIAVKTLLSDSRSFQSIDLKQRPSASKVIRLSVRPGTVRTNASPDVDKQAYRLKVSDGVIEITANGDPGLLYGVGTLVQLFKRNADGRVTVPQGTIEDWPSLQLRFLHWDTKHHQDRIETLKRYLDWSARLKINMIGFELEDKFEYPSNPVIGAPGAFTTAELQEIVNYGLERYIQVVPVIQSPAHLGYVLKHPQFADLRADGNNYSSNTCDQRALDLIFQMYDDVIKATKGVDYLFVSTDENYYAGNDPRCARPYNPENRSLAWAEFVQKAHAHLKARGRRMLIWAEYPLLAQHLKTLPSDIIDGVIGEPEFAEIEKQMGMNSLAYVSIQGAEYLFPQTLGLETPDGIKKGRIEAAAESINHGIHWKANPIGVFGAAWDDSGLHSETFWLGWSVVAQYGWNPRTAPIDQHVAEFMRFYYGPEATGVTELYRLMQRQARSWRSTWEQITSRVRGPGYGNSEAKGLGTERYDLALSAPPLPTGPDLKVEPLIRDRYAKFVAEARSRMLENDQLILGLQASIGAVERNRYNLEVFTALAKFMGHHWRLLNGMNSAEQSLLAAQDAAKANKPGLAVNHLVTAYRTISSVRREGEATFADLTAVFEKSRFPKGRTVNGREFVHVLDDVKDHWGDRTVDLGYMMAPERNIGLDKWLKSLDGTITSYAKQHNVPIAGLAEARLED